MHHVIVKEAARFDSSFIHCGRALPPTSMATLSFVGIATTSVSAASGYRARTKWSGRKPTILCIGWVSKPTTSLSCLVSSVAIRFIY